MSLYLQHLITAVTALWRRDGYHSLYLLQHAQEQLLQVAMLILFPAGKHHQWRTSPMRLYVVIIVVDIYI